jgi:hypothetical protein
MRTEFSCETGEAARMCEPLPSVRPKGFEPPTF